MTDMYEDFGHDNFSNLALLLMSKGYITAEEGHNVLTMKTNEFLEYISSRYIDNTVKSK